MAIFELWNAESGNVLGTFPTEAEALAAVYEAVQRNGERYGALLTLGRESSRGRSKVIGSGSELVTRANGLAHATAAVDGQPRVRPSRTS
jgi:hypothetical protein